MVKPGGLVVVDAFSLGSLRSLHQRHPGSPPPSLFPRVLSLSPSSFPHSLSPALPTSVYLPSNPDSPEPKTINCHPYKPKPNSQFPSLKPHP